MSNLKSSLPTSITLSNVFADQSTNPVTNRDNISELLGNTSTFQSKSLTICNKKSLLSVNEIMSDKVRPDLLRYQKIAQFKVSSSLALSPKRSQHLASIALDNCGRFTTKTEHGHVALNRCNRRSCPICSAIKGKRLTNDIVKCLDQLSFLLLDECDENTPDHKRVIGLKINLNTGSSPSLLDLKTRLSIMHSVWARLLRTAKMRDSVIGAYRSTEITQTDDDHANPHIHGLLLARANTDIEKLSNHVRYYWHRTLKRELKKAEHEANVVASCNQLEPLYRHTKADVREWTRYATKGSYDFNKSEHRDSHSKTNAPFWQIVDDATKGMRLTALSGEIKQAVSLVREQTKTDFDGTIIDYSRTHAWSDMKQTYITIGDYNPDIDDRKAPLCQSIPHTEQPSHFGTLFKAEYDSHKIRRLEKLGEHLLSNGDYSTYSQFDDLFIHDIKTSKPKIGIDYTEPVEIERKALKVRTKSLDSE